MKISKISPFLAILAFATLASANFPLPKIRIARDYPAAAEYSAEQTPPSPSYSSDSSGSESSYTPNYQSYKYTPSYYTPASYSPSSYTPSYYSKEVYTPGYYTPSRFEYVGGSYNQPESYINPHPSTYQEQRPPATSYRRK